MTPAKTKKIREVAKDTYAEDNLEIGEDAVVYEAGADGFWVTAFVWVGEEEVKDVD